MTTIESSSAVIDDVDERSMSQSPLFNDNYEEPVGQAPAPATTTSAVATAEQLNTCVTPPRRTSTAVEEASAPDAAHLQSGSSSAATPHDGVGAIVSAPPVDPRMIHSSSLRKQLTPDEKVARAKRIMSNTEFNVLIQFPDIPEPQVVVKKLALVSAALNSPPSRSLNTEGRPGIGQSFGLTHNLSTMMTYMVYVPFQESSPAASTVEPTVEPTVKPAVKRVPEDIGGDPISKDVLKKKQLYGPHSDDESSVSSKSTEPMSAVNDGADSAPIEENIVASTPPTEKRSRAASASAPPAKKPRRTKKSVAAPASASKKRSRVEDEVESGDESESDSEEKEKKKKLKAGEQRCEFKSLIDYNEKHYKATGEHWFTVDWEDSKPRQHLWSELFPDCKEPMKHPAVMQYFATRRSAQKEAKK
jgi:hypothetical protein